MAIVIGARDQVEKSLRSPGFKAGVPIVLADGRAWMFPKPPLEGGPAGYHDLLEEFYQVLHWAEDNTERLRLKMEMACVLLASNYDLVPEQLAELLLSDFDEKACLDMWKAIGNVLLGNAPRTVANWAKYQLLSVGVPIEGMSLEDAMGTVESLVNSGRVRPAGECVDWMIDAAEIAKIESYC